MNNDDKIFQPGEGPWWGLTPRGRQVARILLVAAVLAIFAAGFGSGVVTALIFHW